MEIKGRIGLAAPAGWAVRERWEKDNPEVVLSSGPHIIHVRLFGGKKSSYKTISDFMASPEARDDGGQTRLRGFAVVSGRKLKLYHVENEGEAGSPESSYAIRYNVVKEFCILPAKSRFYVLSYSTSAGRFSTPKFDRKIWNRFLNSVSLAR